MAALLILAQGSAAAAGEKQIYGWAEHVTLPKVRFELTAKLDTGADHSSLNAIGIRRVRRGDKRYVRFSVADPSTGELVELRRPYLRRTRIKRHQGSAEGRYVVMMEVCLGDHRREVEVSLVDRSEFNYPLLLGRSALEGIAVVDPELTFTTPPTCAPEEE